VPNRILVVAVGLLLIGLGAHGLRAGRVLGRTGTVARTEQPLWFWFRVVLYLGLGILCLLVAWTRYR